MSGVTAAGVMAAAAVAGAGIAAYSALQQGKQAEAMGDYQNRQAQADAQTAESEAMLQARRIREAGDRQRATARASMAESGLTLSSGSAEQIEQKITSGSEEDALLSIYQGNNKANQIRAGGQAALIQGQNAKTAGQLNAASSALGGASRAWSSWSSRPAVVAQQAPAPVYTANTRTI